MVFLDSPLLGPQDVECCEVFQHLLPNFQISRIALARHSLDLLAASWSFHIHFQAVSDLRLSMVMCTMRLVDATEKICKSQPAFGGRRAAALSRDVLRECFRQRLLHLPSCLG